MDDVFPPFEPDEPNKTTKSSKRLRAIPLRYIIPNVITILALCAGVSGVRLAIDGRFEFAVMLVLLAAFLDGVDGRVARLIKGASRFGAELDSLADAINFGVAPALVLYSFVLNEAGHFGWVAALIYMIACVLRLARFNTMSVSSDRPTWQKAYFVGVPAPAGALLVLIPVYLGFLGVHTDIYYSSGVSIFTIIVAFLMLSSLPVWSGKKVGKSIKRTFVMPLFLIIVLYVALMVSFPWFTLTFTAIAYLLFLPWSLYMWNKTAKRYGAVTKEAK